MNRIGTFFLIYSILHIGVFLGLFLALFGILAPLFITIFLIALGILILIDIIFGLYFLISKSPRKSDKYRYYDNRYHKLEIEEGDKYKNNKTEQQK
jgi:uncharacterized membrane protein